MGVWVYECMGGWVNGWMGLEKNLEFRSQNEESMRNTEWRIWDMKGGFVLKVLSQARAPPSCVGRWRPMQCQTDFELGMGWEPILHAIVDQGYGIGRASEYLWVRRVSRRGRGRLSGRWPIRGCCLWRRYKTERHFCHRRWRSSRSMRLCRMGRAIFARLHLRPPAGRWGL